MVVVSVCVDMANSFARVHVVTFKMVVTKRQIFQIRQLGDAAAWQCARKFISVHTKHAHVAAQAANRRGKVALDVVASHKKMRQVRKGAKS